ncbi:glycosyltransferase family 39 protein [Nonomuraea terrae]|uniref:Glycosyltransferase family 39 protein n=1 Tax=Nonomuraea terrae TaxID=2530383 RepID=A0A4R4YGI1_9ACTN|nr:glycosyltransferase family 39 protein [Nonomuraea terrae]TDD43094.1 glycosyltransferase family 39 protein [Nonomuraea terrae]
MSSTLPATPMDWPPPDPARSGRRRRAPADHAPWERPALLAMLLATAVLYLWGLGASGWANSFYAAAAQAGSQDWTAFFFGSSDAANSITVDKTPASLWVMALSARLFGVNAWSILVPQALMGVATVGMLFATVRRWYGPAAGLIAGAAMALTPVAVLMFRFNNPDALLVLLMVAGAYAIVRAVESGATKWLVWAGVFVGFGFLAKMLQALLVVPVFALVYLIAGPPKLGRRILQLVLAGVALVVSGGWYIAVVELVPASMRPYIGGSQENSLLELTLGYNGLGRLNGDEAGSVGGRPGGGWGETGWARMFDAAQGGQVAWLLPAALILLAVGLAVTARVARTDRDRAGFVLWGGWLLITAGVFSFMAGIFHAYYTVALAPALGALTGMGAVTLWRRWNGAWARPVAAATVLVTVWWSFELLGRSGDFLPWLRWVALVGGLLAAIGLLASIWLPVRLAWASAALALAMVLAGPGAYAMDTAATPHGGSIPSAGPPITDGSGGRGGRAPGGMPPGAAQDAPGVQGGTARHGGAPKGNLPRGGRPRAGTPAGGTERGGGMGGLLNGSTPSTDVVDLLQRDAGSYTWVAAAIGSQNASGYQLATGHPVMPVGGFNGSDPSPTLAQFQQYVTDQKIHYFIGGDHGPMGGNGVASEISAWVTATFRASTVGGVTVYDLTSSAGSAS